MIKISLFALLVSICVTMVLSRPGSYGGSVVETKPVSSYGGSGYGSGTLQSADHGKEELHHDGIGGKHPVDNYNGNLYDSDNIKRKGSSHDIDIHAPGAFDNDNHRRGGHDSDRRGGYDNDRRGGYDNDRRGGHDSGRHGGHGSDRHEDSHRAGAYDNDNHRHGDQGRYTDSERHHAAGAYDNDRRHDEERHRHSHEESSEEGDRRRGVSHVHGANHGQHSVHQGSSYGSSGSGKYSKPGY